MMGCVLSEEGGLETDTEEDRPVETQSLREEAETQARTSRQGGWKKERALPTPGLQRSASNTKFPDLCLQPGWG